MDDESEDSYIILMDQLIPHLYSNKILAKSTPPSEITIADIRSLAIKWGIKVTDNKTKKNLKKEQLMKSLVNYIEQISNNRKVTRAKDIVNLSVKDPSLLIYDEPVNPDLRDPKKMIKPLAKNYFGLPNGAFDRTPGI